MSQLEQMSIRRPYVQKSPSLRKQTINLAQFFPGHKATKDTMAAEKLKSPFSNYQKFMHQLKPRNQAVENTQIQHSLPQEEDSQIKKQFAFPRVQYQSRENSHEKNQSSTSKTNECLSYRRSFYSPQNEFFISRLKPVKVTTNSNQENSNNRSNLQSTRGERKDFFSQANIQKDAQPDAQLPNNFTIKLRKSLTSFQSTLYKKDGKKSPNTFRVGQAYSIDKAEESFSNKPTKKGQSEEKIKVVDLFHQKPRKEREKEELRLKTIIRCDQIGNQTSMLSRKQSQDRITFQRGKAREPNYKYQHLDHQESLYFQSNEVDTQKLPSRQRIFSTRTPSKNGLIQNHFNHQPSKLNESREILIKMHSQGHYRSNNTQETVIQTQLNQTKEKGFQMKEPQISQKYFLDTSKQLQTEKKSNRPSRKESKVISSKQNLNEFNPEDKRPETERTDRILDLLLLSTSELRSYFNQKEATDNKKNVQLKVKVVQSKQRFPEDFFNILKK